MHDRTLERLRPWIELLESTEFKLQPGDPSTHTHYLYFRRPMINALIRLQPRGEYALDMRRLSLRFDQPERLRPHLEWLTSNREARLYDEPRFTADTCPGRDAETLGRMNEAFDNAMFESFADYNNDPVGWRHLDAKKREEMIAEDVLNEFEPEEEE